MSLITDIQFVPRLYPYLDGFKHAGGYRWSCRCPFCGDSQKNKHKKRGNIFRHKDYIVYHCFNCGASASLGKLIKHCSEDLYKEYRLESIREDSGEAPRTELNESDFKKFVKETTTEVEWEDDILESLKRLDKMNPDHPAVKYLVERQIPKELYKLFYYSSKFKAYTNNIVKKFENEENDHPRLVIPFFDVHGKVFGFSGRAFGNEQPKYLHVKLDSEQELVYGSERLDFSKHVYVVEGQIDSIFLPNCIAVAGSSFDIDFVRKIKSNCTLILDNEPRNKQIVDKYKKYILAGYKVCMMPRSYEFNDINEAILGGMTPKQLTDLIDANSYSGMIAQAKFSAWRIVG